MRKNLLVLTWLGSLLVTGCDDHRPTQTHPGATPTAAQAEATPQPNSGELFVCTNSTPCIKGDLSESGEKLYYYPGCERFTTTQVTESQGERYFVSSVEAEAAGWRRASDCP